MKIVYRDFSDVPRMFVTQYKNQQLLFDCAFDESLDDYHSTYKVYHLANVSPDDLQGNWNNLYLKVQKCIGEIPISQVSFDRTLRKDIDSKAVEELLEGSN